MKTDGMPSAQDRTLCVVVPCFNEEEALPIFYNEMQKVAPEILKTSTVEKIEYVFVDDGSTDKTLSVLKNLAEKDSSVHFISFSRNFGKEAALYAGLLKAQTDFVCTMDVDLQDPPSLIPEMLEAVSKNARGKISDGGNGSEAFDCAATRRVTRAGEPKIRSFFARRFYKIMSRLSDIEVVDGARDFRVMTRKYRDAVVSLSERNRFTKGIFPWVGFKTKWFEFENVERSAGKTKWSFWKLFLYSLDGIIAFSTKPLLISSVLGLLEFAAALAMTVFVALRKLRGTSSADGWASLVCIILFVAGQTLFALGISGQYLARIYTESKHRPIFIIREER